MCRRLLIFLFPSSSHFLFYIKTINNLNKWTGVLTFKSTKMDLLSNNVLVRALMKIINLIIQDGTRFSWLTSNVTAATSLRIAFHHLMTCIRPTTANTVAKICCAFLSSSWKAEWQRARQRYTVSVPQEIRSPNYVHFCWCNWNIVTWVHVLLSISRTDPLVRRILAIFSVHHLISSYFPVDGPLADTSSSISVALFSERSTIGAIAIESCLYHTPRATHLLLVEVIIKQKGGDFPFSIKKVQCHWRVCSQI